MARGSGRRSPPKLFSRGATKVGSGSVVATDQTINKINYLEEILNNRISPRSARAKGALQFGHKIQSLPRKAAIAVGLAAKMAVGRGALVDRPVELQAATGVRRA